MTIGVGGDVTIAGLQWTVEELIYWQKGKRSEQNLLGYKVSREGCKTRYVALSLVEKVEYPPTYTF